MTLTFDEHAQEAEIENARLAEEEDVQEILSQKYGMQYVDLHMLPISGEALRLIPEKEAQKAQVAAFDIAGKHVSVAIHNPNDEYVQKVMDGLTDRGYIVKKFLVSERSMRKVLKRYDDLSFSSGSAVGVFDISAEELLKLSKELKNIDALRKHITSLEQQKDLTKISRLLEYILAGAFSTRASDIHLEPGDKGITIRFRIDGLLTIIATIPPHLYKLIDSRLKILSGLKLNVRDRAQDGRFSVALENKDIEIRVSLIPNAYGESFVLRILDPSSIKVSFEQLGIHPKLLKRLKEEITRPNGMLLTTGPTGSGKTTTLYAFLKAITHPDIKIITIEDPIEYHLEGIVQTQTKTKVYTFSSGLRSIVRQDPDVIMVGEIRDNETAGIAMQAALTGHFVFSTLHTNNAAGTFPRFADLGVDPKEFASAITVSMAQRLVRKLKPDAKKQVPLTEVQKRTVKKVLSTVEDKSLLPKNFDTTWVPETQDDDDTGYHGRVGLYEAIFMDNEMGMFLRDNPSEADIVKKARKQGYLTMAQDGVLKALSGETTLDEVNRVVDLERD
ncbi:MAG TPA: type II/IV secretion system protein [Candidatus Kaiserbacteria bacterium]|nr:type II/IV secretion system protein [Candidatus Kaiserbacteria bacterium]